MIIHWIPYILWIVKASNKPPPMTADDFFRAADERWKEANTLYKLQNSQPDENYRVIIMFLSVVAVECLYTAFFVYEQGEDIHFPTHHYLEPKSEADSRPYLFTSISLSNNESIRRANAIIAGYWKNWATDLRYLDIEYLKKRLAVKGKTSDDIESIVEKTYEQARNIIREGRKEVKSWQTSKE